MGSPLALMVVELIAADIIRGAGMKDYFNKENGTPTYVKDAKLMDAINIVKRVVELTK